MTVKHPVAIFPWLLCRGFLFWHVHLILSHAKTAGVEPSHGPHVNTAAGSLRVLYPSTRALHVTEHLHWPPYSFAPNPSNLKSPKCYKMLLLVLLADSAQVFRELLLLSLRLTGLAGEKRSLGLCLGHRVDPALQVPKVRLGIGLHIRDVLGQSFVKHVPALSQHFVPHCRRGGRRPAALFQTWHASRSESPILMPSSDCNVKTSNRFDCADLKK